MTMQRIGCSYIITCDICGYTLPEEYDFYDAIDTKARKAWKSRKIKGEWEDVCVDCQFEEQETR